jgi:phospholipase/carboxylesterase
LDLVSRAVQVSIETYDLDADRIGLLGFSQGAIMAFSLLLEAPTRYYWISAHHGYLAATHSDLAPEGLQGKPVLIGAGTADQLIPATRAESAAERFRTLGCDVTFQTYPAGHGIDGDELRDLTTFLSSVLD